MHKQVHALAFTLLVVAFVAGSVNAQNSLQYSGAEQRGKTSFLVTATAGENHIRFASLGIGLRMRLEILNNDGYSVFDSGFREGNLLDWQLHDSRGNRLPDDLYGCLITVEDMAGQLSHRSGVFSVTNGVPRFKTPQTDRAEIAACPEAQETLTILPDDEELTTILLLHDGASGSIVSGKGGLSFRVGNALAGKDAETMHLTAEGNLGIGVSQPQVKLDVAGMVRAEGIMFSDGTIQKTAGDSGSVAVGITGQRLNEHGTLGIRKTTNEGEAETNGSPGAAGEKKQMLKAGHPIDPNYSLEGPTNTFYGLNAGAVTTGDYNSFFGSSAGSSNTTGNNNSFFGNGAGEFNTTGYGNSFFGNQSGYSNTTGNENCFLGEGAGFANTTGGGNSFFGWTAGYYNTTGQYNSFVGESAGKNNTTGGGNSFFGRGAGLFNTAGNWNSFIGESAGLFNTTGSNNSFVGSSAGHDNTTGYQNSFVGVWTGYSNTSGFDNTFVGYQAGSYNTNGLENSFFGSGAGFLNSAGNAGSFFGFKAGYSNTTGIHNSFFGQLAGLHNTMGYYNSFFGAAAGSTNTTGSFNTFIGRDAGFYNTTGNYNSFLGQGAGLSNTSGNNNSYIGALSDGAAGITNATAIGYQAKVTQNNSLVLGSINGVNDSSADTKVGIGTTSPDRKLQIASSPGMNAELHIGGAGDEGKDVFSGMGVDPSAGPAFNFGYAGYSFGRSAGFLNVRPDPSAVAPNPSLRFMTANQQRMIITNAGRVGIGTTSPQTTLHVQGESVYVGAPGEGIILKSPDGLMCVKLTVGNTGALVSTPLACP